MSRGSHTFRVRLLGFLTAGALLIVTLEVASFILFYAAAGRRFSYEAIGREQAADMQAWMPPTRAAAPATAGPPASAPIVEGRPERTPVELVPHPFVGFVADPESPLLLAWQRRGALPLTEHGFFSLPDPPGQGEELSVAVFGGSVAAYFAVDAREAMTRVLHADSRLRGRRVRVHSIALGAYKQPQMLAALAYLGSLGQRFDVVVEIDGFNDIAISYLDHKAHGMFPAYPRNWDGLVSEVPDLQQQRRIGKIAFLQEWRARTARGFSRRPLSWSVTAGLVWKSLDRLIGAELSRARQDLAAGGDPGRYRARGPLRHYANDHDLLSDIVGVWGRSSIEMQHLCAGASTAYHHFLQPNQYLPGSKPMGEAEKAVAYRDDNPSRFAVAAGYPLLRAEGARLAGLGVDFHDLSQLFAGVSEPLYIDDCCHVNLKGNALMGEAVARVILAGSKQWPAGGGAGDSAPGSRAPAPRP